MHCSSQDLADGQQTVFASFLDVMVNTNIPKASYQTDLPSNNVLPALQRRLSVLV
jgi:hypothetical protein